MKHGFTLTELLVVIVIVATIAIILANALVLHSCHEYQSPSDGAPAYEYKTAPKPWTDE